MQVRLREKKIGYKKDFPGKVDAEEIRELTEKFGRRVPARDS
jgi:hypothetical protein